MVQNALFPVDTRISPLILFLWMVFLLLSFALPGTSEPAQTLRQEICLNGTWETAVTTDPAYPPRMAQWLAAEVPALTYSNAINGTSYSWYRKEIAVPDSFRGRQVELLLYGARFNASVYCNGVFVASRLEGYTPFSVDLTEWAKPGTILRLEIRCQDWSAVFKGNYKLPADADPDGERLRGVPKGRLLAPIGGHFYFYGIWDDIMLRARPQTHCEDIAIETAVRKNNTLTITGRSSDGKQGLWIEGDVLDNGKPVLHLPGRKTTAGGKFTLSALFPQARYWSPEDPYRYILSLSLRGQPGGRLLDSYEERFGFREFWANGPDFYLNGIKRHLLASSGWPVPRYQTPEEIRQAITDLKESHAVAFRLHTQPWQHRWLEEADALGLLIVEEGALWCDGGGGYAYDDPQFWKNVQEHLTGMVRRDRNRPSLIMWSLENELLHCGAMSKCSCAEERLAEAGRVVKALDPTHLITYEADHDPEGVADVIGLHYPRELPEHTDYPNTADWLDTTVTTGTAGETAGSWNRDFFWERKKPLYIGEYLWVFQQDYSPGSVFYGDEAYIDREAYRDKAKADAWIIQTLAYRRAGVSGMCPWTIADEGGRIDKKSPLFAAQKLAYTPVAVYPREADTRFFTGEKITRSFDVFNDSVKPLALELRFSMQGWADGHSARFTLEPGGHKLVSMTVPMPAKNAPDGLLFAAVLYTGTTKIHSAEVRYRVYDKVTPTLPSGCTLLVYDPAGKWPVVRTGVQAVRLKKLDELSEYEGAKSILIIGPNAYALRSQAGSVPIIGSKNSDTHAFKRFLSKGGRALVLEQETLEELEPELLLVEQTSTMTFPVVQQHPLLTGLGPEDFKFWRGDHYVSRKEIRRPERWGARALLVSGGLEVLAQAPVVEMAVGQGLVIFSQTLAGTKYDTEPAARRFISNAIAYLAGYRGTTQSALVVAGEKNSAPFKDRLAEIGLLYTEPKGLLQKADLDKTDLLLLHGGGSRFKTLAPLLAGRTRPLTVYWHAPDKDTFEKLKTILGLGQTTLIEAAGPISLQATDNPALDGILREDLTFLKPFTAANWYRVVTPDANVVDHALDITVAETASDRYMVEDWNLTGSYVQKLGDHTVGFYTNGTATREITVSREGLYRLVLEAWGTPAENGWPTVLVKANGKVAAQVSIIARKAQTWPCLAHLPQGKVSLELIFANDMYKNSEDRNLFIRSLAINRVPIEPGKFELFTLPPAIAGTTTKAGLRTLIDCVRWDMNTDNRVRGRRYASTLLANLGATFTTAQAAPEWIYPPSFQPEGEIAALERSKTQLNLHSKGTVKAAFTCATAGEYTVIVRGSSSPAAGVYGKALVRIDGKKISETELNSFLPAEFTSGTIRLTAGNHKLTVEFTNDVWLGQGKEDRNLYINGVGFLPAN